MRFLYYIPLHSRLTSQSLTDGSTQHVPPVWRTVNNWAERQQCWVSRMNWRRWGPPLLCPAETRDCSAGSEDYIIFILLACNSSLQWREKKDRPEDVIRKIFIVIIYRYRNITTLLAGRSYISINHSKLLRPQNCSPALQLSMRTFTLEGFLVDLLSIKNPKQIVEITDFIYWIEIIIVSFQYEVSVDKDHIFLIRRVQILSLFYLTHVTWRPCLANDNITRDWIFPSDRQRW